MTRFKTICAAIYTCGALLTGGVAAAAPVTYTIDQAFWGQYSATTFGTMGTDAWQVMRQADVDANPDSFNYLRGTFTVDWDTRQILSLDFAMDLDFASGERAINFTLADATRTRVEENVSATGLFAQADLETTDGPLIGTPAQPQFTGELTFVLLRSYDTGELSMGLNGGRGAEYMLFPGFDSGFTLVPDYWDYQDTTNPTSSTYGGGYGISVSAVPLPASVPLLIAGIGALAALRRRAATG